METQDDGDAPQPVRRLGNFLSGMETRGPQVVETAASCLGNFLSGMETRELLRFGIVDAHLGNFLSGMETAFGGEKLRIALALETSLVEWKPSTGPLGMESAIPWKLP